MNHRPKLDLSLYLVIDPTVARTRSVEVVLEEAVTGGVTLVQLREKECSNKEFLNLAHRVARILRIHKISFIINDRVDIALKAGAQGVHLGQTDLHWSEARNILGPDAVIGV